MGLEPATAAAAVAGQHRSVWPRCTAWARICWDLGPFWCAEGRAGLGSGMLATALGMGTAVACSAQYTWVDLLVMVGLLCWRDCVLLIRVVLPARCVKLPSAWS